MEFVTNQCPCLLCAVGCSPCQEENPVLSQATANGLFPFIADLLSDLSYSRSKLLKQQELRGSYLLSVEHI